MSMKKKLAAGAAALAVTAMCFGTTAFAAETNTIYSDGTDNSAPVTSDNSNSTEIEVTTIKEGDATWSVEIPKKLSFSNVTATSATDFIQELPLKATILNVNTSNEALENQIANLVVKVGDSFKPTLALTTDATKTIANAYKVKDPSKADVTDGKNPIATLTQASDSATGLVELDKASFNGKDAGTYTGKLTMKITPTRVTVPDPEPDPTPSPEPTPDQSDPVE